MAAGTRGRGELVRRWWSIGGSTNARSTANKNKSPRTATPAEAAITRCSPRADTGEVSAMHAQRVRGVLARRERFGRARRTCGAGAPGRPRCGRLGILVMEADRPSRRPQHQMVGRPHTRCSRSVQAATATLAETPGSRRAVARHHASRQKRTRAGAEHLVARREQARLTVRAAQQPWARLVDHAFEVTTPPPTGSTARTPRRARHPRPQRRHRPRTRPLGRTTARTAHGSPAPHSPTTSARAPPASRRRRPRTAPGHATRALAAVAVDTHPASRPWETQFRATLSALRANPCEPARNWPPHQALSADNRTTPVRDDATRDAQTHQTTPPTTTIVADRPLFATRQTPRSPKANRWIQAKSALMSRFVRVGGVSGAIRLGCGCGSHGPTSVPGCGSPEGPGRALSAPARNRVSKYQPGYRRVGVP